jgi:hypothetical protein
LYIITQPQEITLKDNPHAGVPQVSQNEPAMQEITIIDSTKTDRKDKIEVDNYYIIVGSFRTLTEAHQKAEKLTKDFHANIIVLPPTTQGNYRISCGKYSTIEEAESKIKGIRTKISSDEWIFSLKK